MCQECVQILQGHSAQSRNSQPTTVFFLFDDTEDAWVNYAEIGGPPFTDLNDSPNSLSFRSDRASLIKLPEGDETVLIVPQPTP